MSSPPDAMQCHRPGTRWCRTTAGAVLCVAALNQAAVHARGVPEPFDATYVLSSQGVDIGETRWTLERADGGQFVYESRSNAIGVARLIHDERIEERSRWRLADDGAVQPLRYSYRRFGGNRERSVDVVFDWQYGRVHNTLNGQSWSMPLESGMLDKLVYLLEMMRDLANGAREIRYAIADGGRVKTYIVTQVAEERIDTVVGPLDAIVVERRREDRRAPGKQRVTRMWCARALRFLPVRLEQTEGGETLTLTLARLTGLTPAP